MLSARTNDRKANIIHKFPSGTTLRILVMISLDLARWLILYYVNMTRRGILGEVFVESLRPLAVEKPTQ
jgi:hypothetical protein